MKIEKALANIQLLGTQVKKIEFENDVIVFYEQDDTKKYLDVSYNIKECSYDEKAKEYIGILALYIEMQVENEEKKMKLGMELHGCFQSNEVAETWEKEFRELLQINGTAALYSVARGLVMSITGQSYTGENIVLPMVNVFRLHGENEK